MELQGGRGEGGEERVAGCESTVDHPKTIVCAQICDLFSNYLYSYAWICSLSRDYIVLCPDLFTIQRLYNLVPRSVHHPKTIVLRPDLFTIQRLYYSLAPRANIPYHRSLISSGSGDREAAMASQSPLT